MNRSPRMIRLRREKRIINIIFFPFPCVIITKIGFLASDNGV